MNGDRQEREIWEYFHALRRADEARAPSFREQWEVAVGRLVEPRGYSRPARVAAAVTLVVIVLGVFLITSREAIHRPFEMSVSQWRSPTEFLLTSQADSLLKTLPRVGQPTLGIEPADRENIERR